MLFPLKIDRFAHEEYILAFEWYELERNGLGYVFMNAVERRLLQIQENPENYSFAFRAYRQASVKGFPFTIVYKFFPKKKFIYISSMHHNSKNPKTKFRRKG